MKSPITAPHIVDPASLLGESLPEASPNMMRHLPQTMFNALLSADADAVISAERGQPSPTRTTHRNGYRHRDLDTRLSTVHIAVPKPLRRLLPRLAHGTTQTSRVRTHHRRR